MLRISGRSVVEILVGRGRLGWSGGRKGVGEDGGRGEERERVGRISRGVVGA